MNKRETKNTIKPHTEEKLKFYIHYLERYLPILFEARHIEKINIYDMYCGQSIYKDGRESGAVRTFKTIKEVQEYYSNRKTTVSLTLNDKNKSRIKDIKEWLKSQPEIFETCVHNEDATNLIKKLIIGINSKQNLKTRNLVFIDPYGYKDIDKSLIEKLLQNGRTEIIIFLPINQIYRFKDKTIGDDTNKDFLPLKRFVEQFDIDVNKINGDIALIKKIEESLSFDGSYFSTSYHLKNQKGTYYGLFFMTSHIYGLEKILEVKWELDEQQGSGFNNSSQMDLFLETEVSSKLETSLKDYFKNQRTNCDIYEFTLKQGFLPKHTNIILKKLQKQSTIEVTPESTRKNSFYVSYKHYKNCKNGKGSKINIQLNGK